MRPIDPNVVVLYSRDKNSVSVQQGYNLFGTGQAGTGWKGTGPWGLTEGIQSPAELLIVINQMDPYTNLTMRVYK